ncbi:MAG: hypothetical protein CSA74_06465 [Rhodobacterales bacterium]|nr:MAG: hypothetical protein CSA74_06465 [Rhodobacterales bacterium]
MSVACSTRPSKSFCKSSDLGKKINDELLDELLKGCERPEDLLGDGGLMKDLKKALSRAPDTRQDSACTKTADRARMAARGWAGLTGSKAGKAAE